MKEAVGGMVPASADGVERDGGDVKGGGGKVVDSGRGGGGVAGKQVCIDDDGGACAGDDSDRGRGGDGGGGDGGGGGGRGECGAQDDGGSKATEAGVGDAAPSPKPTTAVPQYVHVFDLADDFERLGSRHFMRGEADIAWGGKEDHHPDYIKTQHCIAAKLAKLPTLNVVAPTPQLTTLYIADSTRHVPRFKGPTGKYACNK